MCKIEEKGSLAHKMNIHYLRWHSIHQPGLGDCHRFYKHIVGVSGLTVEGYKRLDGATAGWCTMLKNYVMVCPVFQMFVSIVHLPVPLHLPILGAVAFVDTQGLQGF